MQNNTLLSIINNTHGMYEGNLIHYFQKVFNARNVRHPYHNFRHMCHVTCEVHEAIQYYDKKIGKRQARAILIASLFHDFNHNGLTGDDGFNIPLATVGIRQYLLKEDADLLDFIVALIESTEYPYWPNDKLSLPMKILRDADMSQTFSDIWMQQIIFGLSEEYGIEPIDMLKKQPEVMEKEIVFNTEWASAKFEPLRALKIEEANELLRILALD